MDFLLKNHGEDEREAHSGPGRMGAIFRVALSFIKLSLVAGILGGVAISGGNWIIARSQESPQLALEKNATLLPENSIVPSEVLGENDIGSAGALSSENYRVGHIILGGDVGVLSQGDEAARLSIENIRGEALGGKNQSEGRALITWKTSKAANSVLSFGKTTGGPEKIIEEDGFGMTHSAVLANLDLATTYLYTVSARDRYGSEVKSDSHVVYTGSREVSLFELIVNALQDVFGWAVKR